MKNIFKCAKLGNKFLTRSGRIAVFIGCVDKFYTLIILATPEEECDLYFDIITNQDGIDIMGCSDYDIISYYQKSINEEKLDKLADEYSECEPIQNNYAAFKAGYRKAMEE